MPPEIESFEYETVQASSASGTISKAYFILGTQYVRYDAVIDAVDPGYPKSIAGNWQGFAEIGFHRGIEAAVEWPNGKVYFFRGAQYARYDISANRIDAGYPLAIGDQWPGFSAAGFAEGVDAAINWGNGKVYFFKGDEYLRYDIAADKVDGGYPLKIADQWPGFSNAGFASNIDTAINWGNGKAYFFKGDKYLRYDIAADRIDDGFPLAISVGWPTLVSAGFANGISATWASSSGVGHTADFSYLTDQFFIELKAMCARMRCSPEDLLGVMESESSVQPWAQNPHGKATGLIQFMPATLVGLGWTAGPDAFRNLGAEQQLPFVERYFAPHSNQGLTSAGQLYQATFLPATLPGSNKSTIIAAPQGPNANAYRENRVLDTNQDGRITVSDLTARINHVRTGARWTALMRRLSFRRIDSISARELSARLRTAVQLAVRYNPDFPSTPEIGLFPASGIIGFILRDPELQGATLSKLIKLASDVVSQVSELATQSQPALLVRDGDIILGFFPSAEVIQLPE